MYLVKMYIVNVYNVCVNVYSSIMVKLNCQCLSKRKTTPHLTACQSLYRSITHSITFYLLCRPNGKTTHFVLVLILFIHLTYSHRTKEDGTHKRSH